LSFDCHRITAFNAFIAVTMWSALAVLVQ